MCFIKQIAMFVGQPLVSNSSPVELRLFSEQTRCNVLVTLQIRAAALQNMETLAALGEPKTLGIVELYI